jgi:hypothetical protein
MANENPGEITLSQPRGVHLVGSIPLASAEEVFRTGSSILGERLRRIPDGETGVRAGWIGWQYAFFANNPSFEIVPPDADAYVPRQHFQVSLPTPLAPVGVFVVLADQAAVEPAYERGMLNELDRITSAIPRDELAIQWDVAIEFAILEGVMPTFLADAKTEIPEQLIRLGNRVPAGVELGYHLCYGDAGHKHFKEPEDTSKLVEVASAISVGVTRTINWIHMPVPRNRSDDAYFAPLRNLKLHPETEFYLGLVHFSDSVEGTRQRIATAVRYAPVFGVATECGLGRRPPETIPDLLRIHSEVAAPVQV